MASEFDEIWQAKLRGEVPERPALTPDQVARAEAFAALHARVSPFGRNGRRAIDVLGFEAQAASAPVPGGAPALSAKLVHRRRITSQ